MHNSTHFATFLAKRDFDAEWHARRLASGLTAHNLDTVIESATKLWDANDDFVAKYAEYVRIREFELGDDAYRIDWFYLASPELKTLVKSAEEAFGIAPNLGCGIPHSRGREVYPITRWHKLAAKFRTSTKKLTAAIAEYRKSTLEAVRWVASGGSRSRAASP
jgi:hypothetical protein